MKCVGSGALAFRLWEQAEQSAIVKIRVELLSVLHGVDTEMPRVPNMSPCFSEHDNNNVTATSRPQGLRMQQALPSAKRYTFYQPLGFHGSACYMNTAC